MSEPHASSPAVTTSEPSGKEAKKQTEDYGTFGQVLYHVVSFTEGYEQQVLYLCMRLFESTMGFTKQQQTMLMTVSIMSRLCFSLVWGLLADAFETNLVMSAGLLFMGIASILLSSTSRYSSILFLRFLHGAAFGCIYPVQQKIISDKDDEESSTSSSTFTRLHALNCIGLGIAIIFAMQTPKELISPYDSINDFINQISGAFKAVFNSWSAFLCIFTMLIAEAPMCTLPYMITYLEYLGVSDMKVGIAILVTTIGGAAGTAAGGIVIEKITSTHKEFGELIAGIVVMGVRLIVCVLFFVSPAPDGRLMWYHYIEFAVLGATLVTVGGVDRPIMRKVIEDKYQASASAIIQCISGISVSVSFVEIFAYVSEKLHGYAPSTQAIDDMEKGLKDNNTEALRKSTMYMIVIGSLLNIACYGALFGTYKTDKEKIVPENKKEWKIREERRQEKLKQEKSVSDKTKQEEAITEFPEEPKETAITVIPGDGGAEASMEVERPEERGRSDDYLTPEQRIIFLRSGGTRVS
ncbi:hypothetical protein BBBOND_0110560 [Babesia bigemina]|uniref:Major facilitator superfamily (MFS) profile domain-containing protein n=1 Tax=Babesia bigemina TaxID=5866 RepID=A0A061D2C9_BABBI|nr:hypothetical protein BBBOND_0110560 [Babesia bigemina]CDR94758.1 hypothetical protein BBBOND_0110560 [Babesia bigemina]|eukprot:XP_012766944.1 hypothetical protein BBBOND_0110560 [Babesia bigemina]